MNNKTPSPLLISSNVAQPLLDAVAGKQHIIWDWNGTILDDLDYAVETINHQLRRHSLATLTRAQYQQVFDFPIRTYYERLGFDFSTVSFDTLCHEYIDQYMLGYRDCRPVAAVIEVLGHTRGVCIEQSILSASEQQSLDEMVAHFDVAHLFDVVCGIDDRRAESKLARGQALIECSRITPDKTVLVGDTLHDCEVAEALGIDVVLVDHGHHSIERLRGAGRPVVSLA